jgi:hypothetical protein
MAKIISFQSITPEIDVNKLPYKYAIPEHEPIKLSNGNYLLSFRVTKYFDNSPCGDEDVEQNCFDNELYG